MSLWDVLTYPFRSGPRRPLAARQPKLDRGPSKPPLGMEATDLEAIARVNRKNDALERINRLRASHTDIQHRASYIEAMPDDETYAARFHRAFHKKGS